MANRFCESCKDRRAATLRLQLGQVPSFNVTSSEAARLAAGKSKGKLVMAAAASPAQPHRGQPLILNFVLNECFNSFTKFPVHK